ncbi:MAG: type II secretion system protein [Ghiorsea sp.]
MMVNIKENEGFSLIEMMVTMLIVSVGMLALGSFYFSSMSAERVAQERVASVHLAEQIIENWQKDNINPIPDCQVAGVAAVALVPNAPIVTGCVPNNGIPVPFDILITELDASAPIPNTHLLHPTGAGAPVMGNLLIVPTNAASAHVKIRTVKVAWTVKGKARDVMLTHITRRLP